MRFYEQRCHGRTTIHTEISPDESSEVVDAVNACCWIEAKQRLGWPLTTVQEWLLDRFYEARKQARRGQQP